VTLNIKEGRLDSTEERKNVESKWVMIKPINTIESTAKYPTNWHNQIFFVNPTTVFDILSIRI
jgi:hypothetical protein